MSEGNRMIRLPESWAADWVLDRALGSGAFSTVYRAVRRDRPSVEAAIKIISIPESDAELSALRDEGMNESQSQSYFDAIAREYITEIDLMEDFKGNTNIVSIEDYKVVRKPQGIGNYIFIRMELLRPLDAVLRERGLTEQEILRMGIDICSALELCASKKIIHRDIKPANIFINDKMPGHVFFKLGDFGVARSIQAMTHTLSKKGTPNYMAPEVFFGKPYDARADLYSLGITLYRLLNNNRIPFMEPGNITPASREAALARRLGGERLPSPENCSRATAGAVLKACEFRPEDRYGSAREMKAALEALLQGKPVPQAGTYDPKDRTVPVRLQENEPKKEKKKKNLGMIAALCICALLVLAGGIILGTQIGKNAGSPGGSPAAVITEEPTEEPSPVMTETPSVTPTTEPTATPTEEPTATPTAEPTATPTAEPTATPTAEPTATPTAEPTATPTTEPTATPTTEPTATPQSPAKEEMSFSAEGFGGQVTVYMTLTEDGRIETLRFDTECEVMGNLFDKEAFASQFIGKKGPFAYRKDGIDAITGATVTSKALLSAINRAFEEKKGISLQVGDVIVFGHYEQDNDPDNGPEPIVWIVLDVKDGKALVLSKYGLDAIPYNMAAADVTWENCTLRAWLNGDFLQAAFSGEEQAAILLTDVDNSKEQGNSQWDVQGGENTKDKVFLLSWAEAQVYMEATPLISGDLSAYPKAQMIPTVYAFVRGADASGSWRTEEGEMTGCWWLRSPGDVQDCAAYVDYSGTINSYYATDEGNCVRPALWINLEDYASVPPESEQTAATVLAEKEKTGAETAQDDKIIKAGSVVTFGHYEQDNDLQNGPEPVEWVVLDVQGGRALLLSKYALDAKLYNEEWTEITWETCSLRKWLNQDFLLSAFSTEERPAILLTDVDNSDAQGYDWSSLGIDIEMASGGHNTQDWIFLLSYKEANGYLGVEFGEDSRGVTTPTAYAVANGAADPEKPISSRQKTAGWWWLRSPGTLQVDALGVNNEGSMDRCGVAEDTRCVRPALWVDVDSDAF